MRKSFFLTLALALITVASVSAQPRITSADKERAASLVKQMTLEEKCALLSGYQDGFHTCPIERLGIPSVRMADGPQGVRNDTKSTYYPCGISLAASFNRNVAKGVGAGIGFDAKARGVGIMLCPGVNIYRSALCGRNFEYYGEDPYLASETALQYITGMQGKGVMSTIKHFALNSQEYDRHGVSSNADERTMNEIYFPTFRKAVEQGHVGAVMTSYNPVNEIHAPENAWLIRENLRKWGFEGLVMSDWTSTYSTLGCLEGGLDLEMPRSFVYTYEYIKPLIERGIVSEALVDEKCQHILQSFIAYGFLDKPMIDTSIPEDYEVSREYAYNAALEGPVLLKNDGILPIKPARKSKIVVLGPNADYVAFGGGSGAMHPIDGRTTTLYQGLSALGKGYNVTLLDWKAIDEDAVKAATTVIFAGGFWKDNEKEGSDRTYALPEGQNEAIAKLAELNQNVVVVLNTGGETDITPWKDSVKAILMAWYAGQDGGRALAAILSGAVSPSGRLPFTFWGAEDKNPASPYYHVAKPFEKRKGRDQSDYTAYTEGIFVGYRGVEFFGVEPMYPFGYGLTYSSFEYSGLSVAPAADGFDVTFTITNTGKVEAAEVAQVYVAPVDPSVIRPAKELKGYEKVKIQKGKSQAVTIHLPASAFEHYDVASHTWKADKGAYKILVGASSAELPLCAEIKL